MVVQCSFSNESNFSKSEDSSNSSTSNVVKNAWWSMRLMWMRNLLRWCIPSKPWEIHWGQRSPNCRNHEQVGTLQPWWVKSRSNTISGGYCQVHQCPKCWSVCFSYNVICPITTKHDNKHYQSSIWWTIAKLIADRLFTFSNWLSTTKANII